MTPRPSLVRPCDERRSGTRNSSGNSWRLTGRSNSLGSHHVRSEFDCGEPSLSDWLKHQASQFVSRDLAKVYVLLHGEDPRVWGYYSISTSQIRFEELPPKYAKGLPKKMGIPAALIGKLAVDRVSRVKEWAAPSCMMH